MEPIFFAQLFGLYFIITGALVAIRRCSIMPAVSDLGNNRGLVLVLAFIELAAGLALVLVYPAVSFELTGIISLIGWVMVVESLLYLALPANIIRKFIRWFNKPSWYVAGGILSILIGVYLAAIGFAFI